MKKLGALPWRRVIGIGWTGAGVGIIIAGVAAPVPATTSLVVYGLIVLAVGLALWRPALPYMEQAERLHIHHPDHDDDPDAQRARRRAEREAQRRRADNAVDRELWLQRQQAHQRQAEVELRSWHRR